MPDVVGVTGETFKVALWLPAAGRGAASVSADEA